MKITSFSVDHFRSIESAEITFPPGCPVTLFGPNNVGKSNILRAMDYLLGERYTPYLEFQDSDYFQRDRERYPNIHLRAEFDETIHNGRYSASNVINFTTKFQIDRKQENCYHFDNGSRMYLSNEERERCQFILIDASRDISRQLSYYSQYSLLSKFSKRMHSKLIERNKTALDEHFSHIKETFAAVPEYSQFVAELQESFAASIDGFEHKLDIDLSAYDPNNYFHSLRVAAKEGTDIRSFDEFGTGEQQVLLLSFMKAYAATFKGDDFILGIEEPESHLHPIAQRWLSRNIRQMCNSGIQVVLTTHSPEFLEISCLSGFVKVIKQDTTQTVQHNEETLRSSCIEFGAEIPVGQSVLDYYSANTFYDQLRGFFARKILLVEGESEFFSLPTYFANSGYDLTKACIEIVNCRGKLSIPRNYRLFKSYGYQCYALFDCDTSKGDNSEFSNLFNLDLESLRTDESDFVCNDCYGYFGRNFEAYMRHNCEGYAEMEQTISGGKPLRAKTLSESGQFKPSFIHRVARALGFSRRLVRRVEPT